MSERCVLGRRGDPTGWEGREALLRVRRYFGLAEVAEGGRTIHRLGGRETDACFRDLWTLDKVDHSTQGLHPTGYSLPWRPYVVYRRRAALQALESGTTRRGQRVGTRL